MLKLVKALASRLNLAKHYRGVTIGLKRPHWLDHEKETLINVAKTSAWSKLRLTAHSNILYDVLVNRLSEDYKEGYLACFAQLDDCIREFANQAELEQIDEQDRMITMQGLEDDKTDF